MKATNRDFASLAPKAAREARVFFLCGDEGCVADAARLLVSLLPESGERVEISGAELRRDPVRLADEAHSTSLFGDTRHIRLSVAGDEAHDAIENLLAGEVEPCPVIITATTATDKSRTAKLLEKRSDALVAMFYPPDVRAVADAVRMMAGVAGLKMGTDLAERIARAVNLDTRLAQSEVTKLALYLDAEQARPRDVDAAALDAVGASTEEDGFTSLVNVVLNGELNKISDELRRMRELELNSVGLLLAFERRAAQLAGLAARLGPSGDVRAFLESEKTARRVFWKDVPDLSQQLRRWRGNALARLVDRLMGLHRQLLTNSQSADLLLSQALAEICRAAARRTQA